MNLTSEQITQIILSVIGLVSTLVGTFLIPYIRVKTSKEQRENTYTVIKYAVACAEQIFNKSGQGIEKYDYVVKYIKNLGIKIDEKDLKVLIESAVRELTFIQGELLK